MQIKGINKLKESVEIDILVDGEEWSKKCEQATKNLSKNIKVAGFRPGKAPINEIKKLINPSEVLIKAAQGSIRGAFEFLEKSKEFEKIDLNVIETPSVDFKDIKEESIIIVFKYDLYPTAKIEGYKKIKINHKKIVVENHEVEKELNKLLKKDTMMIPKKEGALQKGEVANFDFVGTKNGEEFEGGKAENYELEIGSGQFIPGFEEQMLGMEKGQNKDIVCTFPKEYHEKSLAGEEVVFKVVLHDIKELKRPEITKEFITSLKIDEVNTKDDLETYFKKQIYDMKEQNQKEMLWAAIIKELLKKAEISHLPTTMVEPETKRLLAATEKQLQQMGIKFDDYYKMMGKTKEEVMSELDAEAKKNISLVLTVEAIAEKENLTVEEEDINSYMAKIAKLYNTTIEDINEKMKNNLTEIKEFLLHQKVFDNLIEWNKKN